MNSLKKREKKKNSGFTLVELVVVMVIIAIMAAIVVPAFMGYMDKQKREQVMVNAKDCLMVSQSLSSEKYIYGQPIYSSLDALNQDVGKATSLELTGSNKIGAITYVEYGSKGKDLYTIHEFRYTENGITAVWKMEEAKWMYSDEDNFEEKAGIKNGDGGSTSGIVNNDLEIPNVDKTNKTQSSEEPTTGDPDIKEPDIEEPTSEEPMTSEESTTEEPTTSEEPATTEENVVLANVAGGELVINVKGEDILTGKMIKDSDFWPSAEYLQMENSIRAANGDWGFWNEYIEVKKGDLILDGDVLYVMTSDAKIERGNAAKGVASASFSTALDYKNVLTKTDFEYFWGSLVIRNKRIKGALYYDEDENVLFVALDSDYYEEPSMEKHDCWIVLKNMNEE